MLLSILLLIYLKGRAGDSEGEIGRGREQKRREQEKAREKERKQIRERKTEREKERISCLYLHFPNG